MHPSSTCDAPAASSRRLSLGDKFKVPSRRRVSRKSQSQSQRGGRPAARPMTMARQATESVQMVVERSRDAPPPGSKRAARPMTLAFQATKPEPRPVQGPPRAAGPSGIRPAARPMTLAVQTIKSPPVKRPAPPGSRPGARPMTLTFQASPPPPPSAADAKQSNGQPYQRPMTLAVSGVSGLSSQRNPNVQDAVKNVGAPKFDMVKNVAISYESRTVLARAKAKPVQARYQAQVPGRRRRQSASFDNPMYAGTLEPVTE